MVSLMFSYVHYPLWITPTVMRVFLFLLTKCGNAIYYQHLFNKHDKWLAGLSLLCCFKIPFIARGDILRATTQIMKYVPFWAQHIVHNNLKFIVQKPTSSNSKIWPSTTSVVSLALEKFKCCERNFLNFDSSQG